MVTTTATTTTNAGLIRGEDDDIELELGLSIGGSCSLKKPEKATNPTMKNESFEREIQSQSQNQNQSFGFVDQAMMKREIHALRRQEAKKKREEKLLQQQRNRVVNNNNKNGVVEFSDVNGGDEVRGCKRSKREEENNNGIKNVNLNLTVEENSVIKNHENGNVSGNVNVVPVQYPYLYPNPNLFVSGFAYTNAVPYWGPAGGGDRTANAVVQPVAAAGWSFRPLNDGQANVINGCELDQKNGKTTSYGSPVRSSSVVSDNRSSSHEAGGSSDTKSHSSHSFPEQNQLNGSHEHSAASSHLTEISRVSDQSRNCADNIVRSDAAQSNLTRPKEEAVTDTKPSTNPSEESKEDACKPSNPKTENHSTTPLPYMPCVSTTGNGPNGKTINGFLYRYTKTEVSIICVCHGTSFSPAEFVQHAGGTNVTHPLKHITVIPSAF